MNMNPQLKRKVERAKTVDLEEAISRYNIRLSSGRGWVHGPCPVCGGRDRFVVHLGKQAWKCRVCKVGGDIINLACHVEGLTFGQAVKSLVDGGGYEPSPDPERRAKTELRAREAEQHEQRQRAKARDRWRSSKPATGTIVETYLRSCRGISVPIPSTVRFLPPRVPEHHPAMLAPYGVPEEPVPVELKPDDPEPDALQIAGMEVSAVHLTLLKPDGSGKAEEEFPKLTMGRPSGQPIVLAPPNDLLGLAITEGIEDGFTVYQLTGLGVWAAGSSSYMPSLAETVPKWIECVTIYAHDDSSGRTGASGLAEALQKRGFEVLVEGLS